MADDSERRRWEDRYAHTAPPALPSPFVVEALESLPPMDGIAAGDRRPRALDLACGTGRHALLLAARGYRVTAVDYARPALLTLREAAQARALTIDAFAADVESWPIPASHFDLVLVVDFLLRALFPALRAAVAPGGLLVMETFASGQERFGHPRNPAYLLRPGELAATCRGFSILAAYEGSLEHPPRACRAGIAARAPAAR